ncbi:MAG: TRAFs-binding domain-containing protein [Pirellulaceae bacterium]|nr:TRAFs-binding domain-containing protein [Pirellulaceae bacterium]
MASTPQFEAEATSAVPANQPSGGLDGLSLDQLLARWRANVPDQWSLTDYRQFGQRVLKLGEPLVAYDAMRKGLERFADDPTLRRHAALALARCGATLRANAILRALRDEGHRDEETLGILGRTYKDLWSQAGDVAVGHDHLRAATQCYEEAYRHSRGYYSGINAATLVLLLGERERARALAGEVLASCRMELRQGAQYYPLAAAGEASLVLGEWSAAAEFYRQAAEVGRGNFGDLTSTRRNARLIADHLREDRSRVDQWFSIPKVAVFSGQGCMEASQRSSSIPPELEGRLAGEMRERLTRHGVKFGYAGALSALDVLFLEAVLALGGDAHVVLPYDLTLLRQDHAGLAGWDARLDAVLRRATSVRHASEQRMRHQGAIAGEFAQLLLHGLGQLRAERLETPLLPLAVRGTLPAERSELETRWQSLGYDIEWLELANPGGVVELRPAAKPAADPVAPAGEEPEFAMRIMALLFADALNFSKLTEEQIPSFVKHFLGGISRLPAMTRHPPELKDTWGDGLYFVFASVRDAGLFALELADFPPPELLAQHGLPDNLRLRIALHAGPVYSCIDPVTGHPNFSGTHVSRAARIEPITPPGEVFASQEFAALAAAAGVRDFRCEYVGITPLAKSYGAIPTYHVRRAGGCHAVGNSALPP